MKKEILSFYKKKSVLFSWLISYILILLVPMFASVITYFQSSKIIHNQINKSNSAMLKQVQQSLDSRLLEAKKLSTQLSYHNNIDSLIVNRKPLSELNWYNFSLLTRDLSFYSASNNFIDDYYIYIYDTDIILRPGGSTHTDILYNATHKNSNLTFVEWKQLLESEHVDTFISLTTTEQQNTQDNNIAYVTSLPLSGTRSPFATLVILMKQHKFFEPLNNMNTENRGEVFIIDDRDNIIASTNNLENPPILKFEELSQDHGLLSRKVNNQTVIASYISSEAANWKYVIVLPENLFLEKVSHIQNITILSALGSLMLGLLLAYFFSKKNYDPLKELLSILPTNAHDVTKESVNEYRFIKDAISTTLEEKDGMLKKLELQDNTLRKNFLARLIKGKLSKDIPVSEMLTAHNIEFFSDHFAVMLFFIEDLSRAFDGNYKDITEQDIKLIYFMFQNVVEELVMRHHHGFVVEVDDMLVCLINFRELDWDTGNNELIQIANEAKQFIEQNFYIYFTVAISSIQHSADKIAHAYQEALETMEYRLLNRQGGIILYDTIKDTKNTGYSYYTLDMEYQFINCIKIGDYEKTISILNDIFDNALQTSMPIAMVRCLMFNLISTMMKAMDELSIVCETDFLESLNSMDRLLKVETLQEMQTEFMNILKSISDYINDKKKSHNYNLRDEIVNYIKQNYSDINLSVSAIGEIFSMNSAYLSRFFKEQNGETMLDFINKTRIEKAKEIFAQKQLSINETATKVGYYNSTALIRAFKKYEGITPGQYKESL